MGKRTKKSEMPEQNNDPVALAAEVILNSVIVAPKNTQLRVARDSLRHIDNGDDAFVKETLRILREKLKE